MTVVAHAADWIALAFFLPTIAFIVWLVVTQYRERRGTRGRAEADSDG